MPLFFRRSTVGQDPLAVSMTGVRAGERLLQVGLDDATLATQLASKVGLNGQAAFAVATAQDAARAREVAASAGVLAEVVTVSFGGGEAWPLSDGAYDAAIVHGRGGVLARLIPDARRAVLRECHRALRPGGRVIVIEPGKAAGLAAWIGRRPAPDTGDEAGGGSARALEDAGFRPVRLLGDREGFKFVEGLRPA